MKALRPIVIGYHRITDDHGSAMCVSPTAFAQQLDQLLRWGLRPARLEDRSTRSFVVTLDDGYEDSYSQAHPILMRAGVKASFYVCPAFVGHEGPPPGQPAPDGLREPSRFMTWEEVRELRDAGHVIGSHSNTHRELPRLDDDALASEVAGSREELSSRLDVEVGEFCYPRGKLNDRVVRAVAAAGYATAVVTPSGRRIPAGPHTVERVGIYRADTPWRFKVKVLGLYGLLRPLLRRSPN